jgi:enoyl-CoA hydratase/carnithine racemase
MRLIGAVYADEKFDEAVAHTAQQLAAGPTASYATAKRLMREAIEEVHFSDQLAHELDALSHVLPTARM